MPAKTGIQGERRNLAPLDDPGIAGELSQHLGIDRGETGRHRRLRPRRLHALAGLRLIDRLGIDRLPERATEVLTGTAKLIKAVDETRKESVRC